jgi:hypothetical protein
VVGKDESVEGVNGATEIKYKKIFAMQRGTCRQTQLQSPSLLVETQKKKRNKDKKTRTSKQQRKKLFTHLVLYLV